MGFRYDVETNSKFHNQMHCNIGGSVLCSAESPQDPIFWLIHGAVDFHWALWQTCHGYDAIDAYTHFADRTASTNGNDEEYCGDYSDSYIHAELEFPILEDASYSHYSDYAPIRIIDTLDMSAWWTSYDYGDFEESRLTEICGRTLNPNWIFSIQQNFPWISTKK